MKILKNAVLMYLDLQNFSSLLKDAGNFQDEEKNKLLFNVITTFRNRSKKIIEQNQGYIDAFMGDALLSYFHISENKEINIHSAMETSDKLITLLNDLNIKISDSKLILKGGISLRLSNLLIGEIQIEKEVQKIMFSTDISVLIQMQRYCKILKTPIVIDEKIFNELASKENFILLGQFPVLKNDKEISLYGVANG